MIVYLCPVCHREVEKTPGRNMNGHYDRAMHPCPGSFEPFRIALRVHIGPNRLVDYALSRRFGA